jgi:hypothetical protein
MAAFQFPSSNVAPIRAAQPAGERKPSEFWLNVGVTLKLPVGENGALEDTFISLGGVAVDSIEDAIVRASATGNWAVIGPAKNEVLKIVREDLAALAKGQAGVHPMLQVEARRTGEQTAAETPKEVASIVMAALRPNLAAAS